MINEKKIVYLRKFKLEDAENVLQEFKNSKIICDMELDIKPEELTIEKEQGWLKKTISEYSQANPNNINLAIIAGLEVKNSHRERKIEELVGGIGAHTIDYENGEAEICYWIGKQHQGKGYATDALKIFCEILFENFKHFKKIKAEVFDYNLGSKRVLEKSGFVYSNKKINRCEGEKTIYDLCFEIINPFLNNNIKFMGFSRVNSVRNMRE